MRRYWKWLPNLLLNCRRQALVLPAIVALSSSSPPIIFITTHPLSVTDSRTHQLNINMPGIETSTAWKTLATHADRMKRVHLRDLLTDAARNSALTVNANGILFDYSRQNVNIEVCGREESSQ